MAAAAAATQRAAAAGSAAAVSGNPTPFYGAGAPTATALPPLDIPAFDPSPKEGW
jgi:hypothetical protein